MNSAAAAFKVLIVEDEFLIADDLARALQKEGWTVAGPVADAAGASAALDGTVDFAVVDINLDGAISFAVAAELRRKAVPFLFLTGYDTSVVPAELDDVVLVQKPNDGEAVVAEIWRQRQT